MQAGDGAEAATAAAVDPEPKFKAQILADLDEEVCPVLCDTGCQRSCISEDLLRRHPKLYRNAVLPHCGKTFSIDGSRVETLGVINIPFRVKGRYMRMNCRIVRNLVYDFVLGWDFFSKYKCAIHPNEGYFTYENDRVDFLPNTVAVSSTHFSLAQDTVVPPMSKMFTQATFYVNPDDRVATSDTVHVEPLYGNCAQVAVARSISRVQNGQFLVELLNPFPHAMKIRAGLALGHVSFTSDELLAGCTIATDINLHYGAEDSGYESEGALSAAETGVSGVEVKVESESATSGVSATLPKERPPPKPILDYSTVAEDAKPRLDQLKALLEEKHADIFSDSEKNRGKTDLITYYANVRPGPPITIPPYRTTPEMQKEIDNEVHKMLADGLVSHSISPYSAPVMLVKKKLGGWRFVTDFRKINARSERVVYPLPRIDDALQKLKDPRFFSTMDLQKGFWQIPIAEEDRKYFAFSTGTLHVEYNVMPMGAINSSATMQGLMSLILRGLPMEHIICFLDDILVASSTMEDHIGHLDLVLGAIKRAGLKLNPKKCLFAQDSVSCLGHRLSRDGIGPDPANLVKIKKWKPPQSRSEVRSFLGLTGYYRQMIKGYSEIASPLTDLTKSDAEWRWTQREQTAFETLRDYLTSSTIMAYPDFSKPFWVKSDASGSSVGYVLTQVHDKREKVVAYGSKKLTDTQRRYCTYDREFFGVLTAVRAYSHYLRHAKFFIVTDHRPLLSLRKIDPKADATGRRVRWSIELNLYDFDIIYKKGRKHSDADAMSRLTDHDDYAEEEEFAGFMLEGEADAYLLLGMDGDDATTAVELIAVDEKRRKLAEAQDEDHLINEVKQCVRGRKQPPSDFPETFYKRNFSRLVIQDNILFRKVIAGPSGLPVLQAIIPPSLVAEVLSDAHGSAYSGHPGYQRMVDTLHRHVTWPGIYPDCKRLVKKCLQCDRIAEPNPKPRTDLQAMNPTHVFEHVCCDLISLPPSNGWKYVCVFMDVFSKHVACYKMRDKTTVSFTRALEDYVTHLGCPQKLTCDNGAEFCSELVDAVTTVMGIKKRTSVVYRPQSQGNVECWNRQLIQELKARLLQSKSSWPEHMHYVAMAHNASPASRTGESPNLVFYGRELPIPTFTDFSTDTLREKSVREYVKKAKERVKAVHDAVRSESKKRSEKVAEAYNRKVKHTPLQEGELVYYKEIPQNHTKVDPQWSGPVQVVKRHPNAQGLPGTTYTLKYEGGETMRRNYEQLKRVWSEHKGPISKRELPAAPAPWVPQFMDAGSSSDEQSTPEVSSAPIASRTRSRTAPAAPTPAATAASAAPGVRPLVGRAASGGVPKSARATVAHVAASVPPTCAAFPPRVAQHHSHCSRGRFSDFSVAGDPERTLPSVPSSDEEAGQLTNVTLISGVAELSWDTAGEQLTGSNVTGNPGTLGSRGDSQALSHEDHPRAHSDPLGLPPVAPLSRSPSSHGTTPEATQNTILQVSPAPQMSQSPDVTPVATLPAPAMPEHAAVDAAAVDAPAVVTVVAPAEEEDSGSLESFMEFLDVADEEFELRHEVGRRKIDVILHDGYEYRRDRASHRWRLSQLWVCRYASRTKCKGRFHLNVQDFTDFMTGATVSQMVEHNHAPHRVKSYGLADVTEIVSVEGSAVNDTSLSNVHAISQISEGDFSMDFGQSNLGAKASSSPVATSREDWTEVADVTTPRSTPETSWDLVGASQEDASGYQRIKHVQRTRDHPGCHGTSPE